MRPANDRQLATGDKKAKAKAKKMINIIQDSNFWSAVQR
jgi:hypothetical protein